MSDNIRLHAVRRLTVDEGGLDQRLDNFLLRQLGPTVPKTFVYRIIRKGEVRVNKRRARPEQRLQMGDEVRIPPVKQMERPKPTVSEKQKSLFAERLLYEDDAIMIVNKPAGMPVHGGSGVSLGVIDILRARYPGLRFLELAHRLDKGTSGCLVLAKTRPALLDLHTQFKSGVVDKRYLALTRGRWPVGECLIEAPLLKNQLRSGERVVKVSTLGKPAASRFRLLKSYQDASLVEVTLLTGRTHQIRVHAAFRHHPLAGDDKYGADAFNESMAALGLQRLFLHAHRLALTVGQAAREKITVTAPLAPELEACLANLEQLL